ncbi:TIGR02466 family protein [Pseudomonas putida]|nr:TIGR02466 family protein [Pseudomonas putida]
MHWSPMISVLNPELIEVTRLFPTPIAKIQHPDADRICAELRDLILQRSELCPGTKHSNQGGWQSEDFVPWAGKPGAELLQFAQDLANEMSAISTPDGLVEAKLAWKYNAWANVNGHGHANAQHAHPGAYWSAVFWVDDGSEPDIDVAGELEFIDPRGVMPLMYNADLRMKVAGCLTAGNSTAISPSSGHLLMFPSWLMHSVRRYEGRRPRISVAFNFSV